VNHILKNIIIIFCNTIIYVTFSDMLSANMIFQLNKKREKRGNIALGQGEIDSARRTKWKKWLTRQIFSETWRAHVPSAKLLYFF